MWTFVQKPRDGKFDAVYYKHGIIILSISTWISVKILVGSLCMYFKSYIISLYIFRYETEFGFTIPNRDIIIDDIRVRAVGKSISHQEPDLPADQEPAQPERVRISYIVTIFLIKWYDADDVDR